MDKSQLLDRIGAVGEDRLLLAKVLDRADILTTESVEENTFEYNFKRILCNW